ncbi:MAG: N-succinylarginine dihydrolase [Sphingomonadales bacterium]|nr:N-succinylarginine dihydrolase [Sphingomonadales bacterium]
MTAYEVNFDGLIGPTHNYAGLSFGNVASADNALQASNPREAALQGLAKMKRLAGLGLVQGVLPPHDRPHLATLRWLGFAGSDEAVLAAGATAEPELLRNVMAASPMWTANAATVAPGADTADGRVHFTPANLAAMFHRALEAETTGRILAAIFADEARFAHHPALPGGSAMGDEGAANHNRFAAHHGAPGVHMFVYGRRGFERTAPTRKFPARQAREASAAIARLHGLDTAKTVFVRQNPAAIDAGAFHNDVVAVANLNVLFHHERAFADTAKMRAEVQKAAGDLEITFIEAAEDEVPMADAVTSYLFNSQLVSLPGEDGMTLILPIEARETETTRRYLDRLVAEGGPIARAEFLDVRQSMRNGGGPACLRLRVVLTEDELAAVSGAAILDQGLYDALTAWVGRHYRDRLAPDDLADPALMRESFQALDDLTEILKLGSIYDFQRD